MNRSYFRSGLSFDETGRDKDETLTVKKASKRITFDVSWKIIFSEYKNAREFPKGRKKTDGDLERRLKKKAMKKKGTKSIARSIR